MNDNPTSSGPDFSQPIAALKQCHDRIRKELLALEALPAQSANPSHQSQAQQGAAAALRYFDKAAPIHHADEEEDLIPMLQAIAIEADAALLKLMVPGLMEEHREMARTWARLRSPLQQIAAGNAVPLDLGEVKHFSLLYAAHMDTEETHIATMAKRLLDPARMQLLGNAMRARRGMPDAPAPAGA